MLSQSSATVIKDRTKPGSCGEYRPCDKRSMRTAQKPRPPSRIPEGLLTSGCMNATNHRMQTEVRNRLYVSSTIDDAVFQLLQHNKCKVAVLIVAEYCARLKSRKICSAHGAFSACTRDWQQRWIMLAELDSYPNWEGTILALSPQDSPSIFMFLQTVIINRSWH